MTGGAVTGEIVADGAVATVGAFPGVVVAICTAGGVADGARVVAGVVDPAPLVVAGSELRVPSHRPTASTASAATTPNAIQMPR